jgi:hypothetical protein
MPRFRIRKPAEADIDTAFAWYESQREGLGLEFLTAVEATLALIQRSPDQFPRVHRDVRRALVRRFPYAVFYLSTPQRRECHRLCPRPPTSPPLAVAPVTPTPRMQRAPEVRLHGGRRSDGVQRNVGLRERELPARS